MKTVNTLLFLLTLSFGVSAQSMTINGPTTVTANSINTYTITFYNASGQPIAEPSGSSEWYANGANMIGSSTNSSATFQFTSTGYISYNFGGSGMFVFGELPVTVVPAPTAPVATAATSITTTGFTANWNSVSGAASYRLDVSTNSSFSSFVTGYNNLSVTGNSKAVTGLSPGTTYYYRLRTVSGSVTGGNSNVITVVTLPAVPTATAATNMTVNSFRAKWTTTNGSATTYRLDVSTSSTFSSFVAGYNNLTVSGTNLTVTGLAVGTPYYYRVRAVTSSGTSANSITITVSTLSMTAPVATAGSSITASGFTANWNSVAGATGYRLDVSTDNTFSNIVTGYNNLNVTGTSKAVTGLSPGTTYYYRLRAESGSGTSPSSNVITVVTLPAAPTASAATDRTETTFTANWTSANGSGVTYRLDVSTSSTFSSFVPGYNNLLVTGTSQTVSGLTQGITYYYRIRAVVGSTTSANSTTITTSTLLQPPVALPATNKTGTSFKANWTAVSGATGYRLDVSTRSDFSSYVSGYQNLSLTTTNRVVSGLSATINYYYRVRTVKSSATSSNSNTIMVIGIDKNFVKTTTVLVENIKENNIDGATLTQKTQSYAFFDGLGRPSQEVLVQQSPGKLDVVQPHVYDGFGMETIKYLPYTSGNDGWYKSNFIDKTHSSYNTNSSVSPQYQFYHQGGTLPTDDKPYSEVIVEPSPLSRVIKQGAVGAPWQPDGINTYSSTDKTIKKDYHINVANEVLYWTYTAPVSGYVFGKVNAGTASTPTYYPAKQLYKNKIKDEHGREIIEYQNLLGQLVMKKVQGPTNNTWACTYYIYDVLHRLVCVVPPEAVALLATQYYQSGATDATKETFMKRWAFRYTYDVRNRMVMKQVPGAEPMYMVYDSRDRLVMSQDGNQRAAGKRDWTFTKYDALNRPVMTGIYTHSTVVDQGGMQSVADGFYPSTLPATKAWYETYSGSGMLGYDNKSFPTLSSPNVILTVSYYDSYAFKSLISGSYNDDYESGDLAGQPANFETAINGQMTGSQVRVLGGTTLLWTVNYYDDHYRVIQSKSLNHKNGVDRITNMYDFVGKVLMNKTTHNNGSATQVTTRRYEYDHAGRLLKTYHQLDNSQEVLLSENSYNELGEMVTKELHSRDNGTNFAQQVDYRYTIRGWLDQINDVDNPGEDLFSMDLNYNDPGANGGAAQYNGNISEIRWTGAGSLNQSYGYSYDAMNRITTAKYFDMNHPLQNGRFDEWVGDPSTNVVGYDLNGNIKKLFRWGQKDASHNYGQMDNLTYTYTGNQVTRIDDAIAKNTGEAGFKEDVKTNNEYTYDANGNMIKDSNKGITAITYNHLNLPLQVNKGTTNYIVYTYDATGRKLSQQVFGTTPKITDYLGEYVYEGNVLQFINHEEGRIIPTTGEYQYHLKDHLGNVRLTFSENSSTSEYVATFERSPASIETQENNLFRNMVNSKKINFVANNHTPGTGKTYSYRLSGTTGEVIGPAKSITVSAGDALDMEVYAKYNAPTSTGSGVGTFAAAIIGAFGLTPGGTNPIDGAQAHSTFSSLFSGGAWIAPPDYEDQGAPKAFLNYLLFDANFNLMDAGFDQVTTAGAAAHDYLSLHVKVKQAGYLYVYLSNENGVIQDVFFDDFKITYSTKVEQSDDYYPFGLTFNSYQRENSTKNQYQYNGKEMQEELGLGWLDYGARMYMSDIGRWGVIDPLAHKLTSWNPYSFVFGNPVNYIDPDGQYPWPFHVRSFISTSTTGAGLFRGDGRGPSLQSYPNATSRVRSTFTVDPAKGSISNVSAKQDFTLFYGTPPVPGQPSLPPMVKEGTPTVSITNENFSESNASFDFHHFGKDPITPSIVTPNLDVHSSLSVTEDLKKGILSITGSFTGDSFPSTEAFVVDQSGNTKVFLGAKKEDGGIHSLFGDNTEPMFNVNMKIMFDNDGNFTGVSQGTQTYSIDEWNKRVQDGF